MHTKGYDFIIITNQAGIARGYYTEDDFKMLTEWMVKAFAKESVTITGVYYCPFHVDGVVPEFTGESEMRKPNPGMLLQAARDHGLDLGQSMMIGDKESDVDAGKRAGVSKTIRVDSEETVETSADHVVSSIAALPQCLGW